MLLGIVSELKDIQYTGVSELRYLIIENRAAVSATQVSLVIEVVPYSAVFFIYQQNISNKPVLRLVTPEIIQMKKVQLREA